MNDTLFDSLGAELDRESWDYLQENYPSIADAIQSIARKGATPDQFRAYVIRYYGINRIELAKRIESAVRHLQLEGR